MKSLFAIGLMAFLAGPAAAQEATGFYGGVQVGAAGVGASATGHSIISGFFIGFDAGNAAIGLRGELDYSRVNIDMGGGAQINGLARVKLHGGYSLGSGFFYGTAGLGMASTNPGGEGGILLGAGFDYDLGGRVSVGSEVLYHDFSAINSAGQNAELVTLSARVAFQF